MKFCSLEIHLLFSLLSMHMLILVTQIAKLTAEGASYLRWYDSNISWHFLNGSLLMLIIRNIQGIIILKSTKCLNSPRNAFQSASNEQLSYSEDNVDDSCRFQKDTPLNIEDFSCNQFLYLSHFLLIIPIFLSLSLEF